MECTKWHPEEGHDVFICRRHVHHRQLQSRRNGRPPAGKNLARRECHRPNFVSVQKNVLSVKQSDLIRECGMNSERDTFTEPPMNDRTREFNNLGSTHNQSLSRRLQIITAVSDNHGQIIMCEQRLEGQGPNRYYHNNCHQQNQCSSRQCLSPMQTAFAMHPDRPFCSSDGSPGRENCKPNLASQTSPRGHVIFTMRKFKTVVVLLTLIYFSMIPKTYASGAKGSGTNNTQFATRRDEPAFERSQSQANRFGMNWSSSLRTERASLGAEVVHETGHLADTNANSSLFSSEKDIDIKDSIKYNSNNNRDINSVHKSSVTDATNILLPPKSEQRKKPSRAATKSHDVLAGAPFVRAHTPGFISLVNGDDDEATKGSSSDAATAFVGGNFMMLTPQLAAAVGSRESSPPRVLRVGPCLCWNTTDGGHKLELECTCSGPEMTNVPNNLPSDIHRLTVEQAVNFTTLGNDHLKSYGNSLRELVLTELSTFKTIKNGTFAGLRSLNTIYIHGAPALTHILDAVFNVYLPELKIIRITHSSLEIVPNLSQLHIKKDAALHMVELDNNQITQLIPGSFMGLITEHLALSYNNLEEIGPSAFEGSTLARLTLKGNPLRTLNANSFVGIDSLRVLDLSETQITTLPTHGLSGLESLRLEKVWTLSVIPSIYHFQDLQEAWLTWPYHCCAFEFPETHDPAAFQRYQEYVRSVVNELCAKASANSTTSSISTELSQQTNDFDGGNSSDSSHNARSTSQRLKRHLRLSEQTTSLDDDGFSHYRTRETSSAFPSFSPEYMRSRNNNRDKFWINESAQEQTNYAMRINRNRNVVQPSQASNEHVVGTMDKASHNGLSPLHLRRLRKRFANEHHHHYHPRQTALRRRSGRDTGESGDDRKRESETTTADKFHHQRVQYNGEQESNRNPFDKDDEGLHYGNVKPGDPFDPFVFDPDQSFAPILDPNDLEHESSIMGKDPWGTFGHASEVEFDEDIGIFHPSVTPSPTVITLCGNVAVKRPPKIACHPLPDAFNPCEDIMGSIWLRGAVWVVVALALFGNSAVLVVLLLAPGRISVQRFLMANLSWADLCMGIYLLMVATQDLVSLGSYFNYAIDWQLGWGCQIAGFLTVFASELSVFTLAVITGERWYALTRAIHLTKRLTLFGAAQLMAFGWFMAILLAALPLMGVSSYSKTSICLPMEAHSGGAVAYLVFLLLFNGIAFLLVACAYWHMYRAVAGHGRPGSGAAPAASSADTAIAKKMALLVFTDFACWAPVAFFGLTAVGGMPLIGVTDSKILLVFFYPLNACCNPYLYAILTKQYRRDLLLLLSRHGICTKRAAKYKTGAASTNNTMQTMQTVLRVGSLTETKVATAGGGGGRGGLLNGSRQSVIGTSPLDDEGHLRTTSSTISGPCKSQQAAAATTSTTLEQDKTKEQGKENLHLENVHILSHSSHMLNSPSDDFRKALHLQPPTADDDEDDDVFDLNGLSGRHFAETTFINVPISPGGSGIVGKKPDSTNTLQNGDTSKEKLIQQPAQPGILKQSPKSAQENLITVKYISSGSGVANDVSKDEHELDHDITETTPFCTFSN